MRIDLSIRDINYAKTVLYWTVEKDINEDVNKFNYIVQISESPNGPWQDLFTPGIYAFGYIDTTTQRGMIDQRIYYRIQAINEIDGSKFYSSSVSLSSSASPTTGVTEHSQLGWAGAASSPELNNSSMPIIPSFSFSSQMAHGSSAKSQALPVTTPLSR